MGTKIEEKSLHYWKTSRSRSGRKKPCDEENLVTTTHNCEVRDFREDAKVSVYRSTIPVKQLAGKVMKRAPKNNIRKNNMQRKENKRGIQDVDKMETKIASPTVKKVNNTNSQVLEAGSSVQKLQCWSITRTIE